MNSLLQPQPIVFKLPEADIIYYPQFFDKNEADTIFEKLTDEIPWQQNDIRVFGKVHPQPRLTALYENEGKSYSYSNIKMQPHPCNSLLQKIKSKVESVSDANFSTVLLNLHRDEKDSNSWHSDNEKELGINPIIASVSFGTERVFQLKHKTFSNLKQNIVIEHASLLLMKGTTQHFWKHQIPKTAKKIGVRINFIFRIIQ